MLVRPLFLLCGLALLAGLAACGSRDERLERLSLGISRDSMLLLMDAEPPARVDPYLIKGQYFEALYFRKPGADTTKVPDREMSPVILVNGMVAGWGWEQWDSIATANLIQLPR